MNSAVKTNPILDVAFLPSLITPESLAGQTVIVVDVLRATTTIIHAMANGCKQVLPQPSIESARKCHAEQTEPSLLGGERNGKIVDGFHNGNSPVEYTRDVIEDKTLILATTNGTVAMETCRQADRVLIGAMVNIDALTKEVLHSERVTVLCSGTDRFITSEDVIFAGALMESILKHRTSSEENTQLTDSATIAMNHWLEVSRSVANGERQLADFFRNARGGINLVRIGHDPDIVFASQIDSLPIVPELDLASWTIRQFEPTST
jgi:2-phosphosulfolactate phosphatase